MTKPESNQTDRAPANLALQQALKVQLKKRFSTPERDFALDLGFTLAPGITILFGPSGAGKTTLLDCIAGLTTPDAGNIFIGDRCLFDLGTSIPVQRRKVGYVLQDLALFPHLTAEQNIQYGLAHLSATERQLKSATILESFHIAHIRQSKPREISGGERQRVALARTLVTDPRVLLLDEPLAALDAATKSKIIEDLRAWNSAHSIPILYVTHNREEVFTLGERVLALDHGRIIADGTPHAVMGAPRQESLAQLIGFENILHATMVAAHEDRGTMTCRIVNSNLDLETPLVRAEQGVPLLVGIRAGDILLATKHPQGLSARNVVPGRITSLTQRDVIVTAKVDCGVELEVHLTLAARESLRLQPNLEVWLIVKTHSCHLMV